MNLCVPLSLSLSLSLRARWIPALYQANPSPRSRVASRSWSARISDRVWKNYFRYSMQRREQVERAAT